MVEAGLRGRRRWVALLPLGLLGALLSAPWALPDSPGEILDPKASRNRAPGTRLYACELTNGSTLLADRVAATPAGGWTLERAGVDLVLSPGALVRPPTPRRHPLGTDRLGRDLLALVVVGSRNTLSIALAAAALALALGAAAGLISAHAGGSLDLLAMRLTDVLAALPKIFIFLAIAATLPPSPLLMILSLAAITWMPAARQIRAEALTLRHAEFVRAAQAAGGSPGHILRRHLLPHLTPTLATLALTHLAGLILLESALSFVGAGLDPATPSLGALAADVAAHGTASWWLVVFPGLAIVLPSVASFAAATWLTERRSPLG